jgi:hypothetical protein
MESNSEKFHDRSKSSSRSNSSSSSKSWPEKSFQTNSIVYKNYCFKVSEITQAAEKNSKNLGNPQILKKINK